MGLPEFLNHVEAQNHEWLGNRDHLERLHRKVVLLGIVLAAFACLDEVPGVGEGRRPLKLCLKAFPTRALRAAWCAQMLA